MSDLHIQEFFTYETKLPHGIGFGTFHLGHFLWLFGIFLGTVYAIRWHRKLDEKGKSRLETLIAASLVVWIGLRAIYIAILHEDFLYELPFHLCSMAGILCAIHCVTRWEWLGQVLYSLCLPGAVLALLFPNWSFYPVIHFLTIEAFLFHMGIVLYLVLLLDSHQIVPDIRRSWQVLLFMAAVVTPIYFFDKKYDVNYMFVNRPSAGSPLVWLSDWLGEGGYLLGYGFLMILCVVLMDIGYGIYRKQKKKRNRR